MSELELIADLAMGGFSKSEQNILMSVLCRAADAARVVTLAYFRQPDLGTENKAATGYDPVTIADRKAELAIREILQDLRPHDGILGEEYGEVTGSSGLTWVLDPIDGTRGFVAGAPTWGTLISLRNADGPVLGLIDQPYIGERFIGGFGVSQLQRGSTRTPLAVRPAATLADATLASTMPEIGTPVERAAFNSLSQQVRLTRFGMDCYAYALVAAGTVDLVVEAGLNPYDIQAPIAVVQAAGGIVSDWQGNPVHDGGRVIAAASAALHDAALEILSQADLPG